MEPMIMKDGRRLVVFNELARNRLAIANTALRHVRNRAGLLPVIAVYIDAPRPLILLRATPPEILLDAVTSFQSHRLEEGKYQVRCTAFNADWEWISDMPGTHAHERHLHLVRSAA